MDERGDYAVDVSSLLNDNRVWRVIKNGYPYKSLDGLSDYEAYFATKQGIYCALGKRKSSQFTGLNTKGKKIVEAIKKLEDIGLNGTETRKDANLKISKSGSFVEEDNYYSQTYTVTSNVDIESYQIEKTTGFPAGSFVANSKGSKATSFNGGETFKIMIPKSELTQNINGTITISAKCKTYPVFVGKTRIADTQNYALTYDAYENFTASTSLNVNTNNGKVQVIKKDAETLEPMEGVKFQLLKADETLVATAITDSDGIATFLDLYQGDYKLRETATNNDYVLSSEDFNITVEYNKTTVKEITNELKKGQIEITKISANNNELNGDKKGTLLKGAVFEIYTEDDVLVDTITTGKDGKAISKMLKCGNYYIKEKSTGSKYYQLNAEKFKVEIKENNEVVPIIVENKSVEIVKKLPKTGF